MDACFSAKPFAGQSRVLRLGGGAHAPEREQAREGLHTLDRCVQAVCCVAEGRRRWEATTHTKSHWSGVKGPYLSLQLPPNDDSMAGNKQRWVCREGGSGDRKTRSQRWSDSIFLSCPS